MLKRLIETSDEDNDSREVLNTGTNTMQYLNESKEQKINVNLFNNKSSINNENIKMSSINNRDTINYDLGPVTNSIIKPQGQNIKNSIENKDVYISDYK